MYYFAYGSNMLHARLTRRCPSARAVGIGRLDGWELDFSKTGGDGSGKAVIFPSDAPGAAVWGVVFTLAKDDCNVLDRIEGRGRGYERADDLAIAAPARDVPYRAISYIAQDGHRDGALKPFDWYRDLVLGGARQNALPEAYQAALARFTAIRDPVPDRPGRLEALAALGARA
ncbi:MAG: gamma-glutamylcyclotransferase family protein [Hyphomicrobiaceae bacterium]